MSKVWAWGSVALLGGALGACSVLQLGPAGSPSGGPYCFQEPGKPDACYQSESEQAAAQSQRQEAIRAEETRKGEAARAPVLSAESPQGKQYREEAEAKAAAVVERDRVFAERHAAEDARRAADATRAAELHALAQDKAYAVPAISAIMCSIQEEIVGLKADLAFSFSQTPFTYQQFQVTNYHDHGFDRGRIMIAGSHRLLKVVSSIADAQLNGQLKWLVAVDTEVPDKS